MRYIEFIKVYDSNVKPASTIYHKHIPKRIAKLMAYPLYYLKLKPNHISILSFLFLILAILCLNFINNISGILLFYSLSLISYSFDCVDGVIARITNTSSEFGAFFDLYLDRLGQIIFYYFLFFKTTYQNSTIDSQLIAISLLIMFSYSITSILRSFKIKKLDGTMKNKKGGIAKKITGLIYEFIDTGTVYFLFTISFLLNLTSVFILFYGLISFILTIGIIIFSYAKDKKS